MPKFGTNMTKEERDKRRAGRYKWLYGDNWEAILKNYPNAADRKLKEVVRVLEVSKTSTPEGEDEPLLIYGPAFLGKKEFLKLAISRLRDPSMSHQNFVDLAKLYVSVKRWGVNTWDAPHRKKDAAAPDKRFSSSRKDEDGDIHTLVRKIEQAKKEQNEPGQ